MLCLQYGVNLDIYTQVSECVDGLKEKKNLNLILASNDIIYLYIFVCFLFQTSFLI